METNKVTVQKLHDDHAFLLIQFAKKLLRCEETAKDVVYEMFAEMLPLCPAFDNEDHAVRSLYVRVRNRCYDILDHTSIVKTYSRLFLKSSSYAYYLNETEETEMLMQEQMRFIYNEIEKLPNQTRIVMKARLYEEKSVEVIAIEQEMSKKTVRNHLAIGVSRIRGVLQEGGNKFILPKGFFLIILYLLQLIRSLLDIE